MQQVETTSKPSFNFIDPSDLIIEQVYEDNNLDIPNFEENSEIEDYNGFDTNSEDQVVQNDLRISTGIYLDIDKGEESDSDCEEKKKKFWFLPFSVNQSVLVDSNLIVSHSTGDSNGLFKYKPNSGELQGEVVYRETEIEDPEEDEPEPQSQFNYTSSRFQQFDDESEKSSGIKTTMAIALLVISPILYSLI